MKITFDPAKDAANREKHGVPLRLAGELEWDTLLEYADTREGYGEGRYIGFALRGAQLYCVVYTDRGDVRRVISLRRATNHEKRNYVLEN